MKTFATETENRNQNRKSATETETDSKLFSTETENRNRKSVTETETDSKMFCHRNRKSANETDSKYFCHRNRKLKPIDKNQLIIVQYEKSETTKENGVLFLVHFLIVSKNAVCKRLRSF